MPFELVLEGKTYRTDDLTIEEAEIIEDVSGRTWLQLNPMRSAKEFRAVAVAFLSRDFDADKAKLMVAGLAIQTAQDAVRFVDDDLPRLFEDGLPDPKAEGGNSTSTSSSSPDPPSDGPPT